MKIILSEQHYNFLFENVDGNVHLHDEVVDYSNGQASKQILAYIGDELGGLLQYSEYEDWAYIEYIKTAKPYKRMGLASKMLLHLIEIYDGQVDLGMTTPDGTKFINAFLKKHPDIIKNKKAQNLHYNANFIAKIKTVDRNMYEFAKDYYINGDEVWSNTEQYGLKNGGNFKYVDVNDLVDVIDWTQGAKNNNNIPNHKPPSYIDDMYNTIINLS